MKVLKKAKWMHLVLLLTYAIDMTVICVFGKRLLDSDISSEMLIANKLNEEHSIIGLSKNWYYSSELRFLHIQWFHRIGLFFSPNNWHIARVISMTLALAMLAALAYLLFVKLELKEMAPFAATVTIMPAGSWYFWQTLFGAHYIPYIAISFLTIICIVELIKDNKSIKKTMLIIFLCFLGVSSGINGVKQLMVFYAPLCITAILLAFFAVRGKRQIELKSKEIQIVYWSLLASACSAVGYLFNSKILCKIYTFQQFNDTVLKGDSVLKLFRDYIWSFGYAEGMNLISAKGIAAVIGLLIGGVTVFCAIRLLIRLTKFDLAMKFIALFSMVAIAFCIVVFAYVGGGIQYFQPCVPFGLFLIVLDLYTEDYCFKNSKTVFAVCFVLMLLVTSFGTISNEFGEPLHDKQSVAGMEEVVAEIQTMGYTQGIGLFWDCDLITELSDGEIEMWCLEHTASDEMYKWLQNKSHYGTLPSGQYFFINRDYQDMGWYVDMHPELELVYSGNGYNIYGN